jgi:hypothetical protein
MADRYGGYYLQVNDRAFWEEKHSNDIEDAQKVYHITSVPRHSSGHLNRGLRLINCKLLIANRSLGISEKTNHHCIIFYLTMPLSHQGRLPQGSLKLL